MPIGIDEFESDDPPGGESVPRRVVAYLASNHDQAFTRAEIVEALEADRNTVGTALSRLKDRGLVRHRGEYWAITDDLERVRAAYDLHAASAALDDHNGGIDADA